MIRFVIFCAGAVYAWLGLCVTATAESAYPACMRAITREHLLGILFTVLFWVLAVPAVAICHWRRRRSAERFPPIKVPTR
ncbi:MAG: hypothetical protein ACOZAH_09050 [Pseudomonadota bacterium]